MTPSDTRVSIGSGYPVKDLLDLAVKIASNRGMTKIAAINNLLEVLESESSGEDAVALTAAFVLRQAGRRVIDQRMAQMIAEELMKIFTNSELDPLAKKEAARKLLGLVKWVTETADGFRVNLANVRSFEEFVNLLSRR